MREILFRGKRIDNGEWIVGHLLKLEDGRARINASHTDIFCYELDESIIQTVAHMVVPNTVGQYTGLTDRDGKKIFEDDIVEADNGRLSSILVVKYGSFRPAMFYDMFKAFQFFCPKENCFGLYFETQREQVIPTDCKFLKVIGNIHDNPNFFEGGADNGT